MKIALQQFSPDRNMQANVDLVLSAMENAAARGAQLFCTPELCLSPFFPQFPGRDASNYAVGIDDDVVKEFQDACRELKLAASPNFYLQEGEHCYDASLMIDVTGEMLGISKMVHICQAPSFYEQDYYTPSDSGFRVYDTSLGKIGIVICFDRHFAESVRSCVLRGAEIILIPTANTRTEPRDLFEWELRVAAMQNGVFIACCNRVGVEDEMDIYGESIVIGPNGDIIAKAAETEQVLVVEVNLAGVEVARKSRPYLELLRPETYQK